MRSSWVLAILAMLFCSPVWAQTPADLRGIYIYTNDVSQITKATASALTASFGVPGVDGVAVVIGWDAIEPAMGQYQWTLLDQWIGQAISSGKKIDLVVTGGGAAPSWLFLAAPGGAGATPLSFAVSPHAGATGVCDSEIIAAPWDPAFLSQWDAMLAALAAHLKSAGTYGAVTLLRLTGVNRTTEELRLPAETAQSTGLACVTNAITTWQQAGYRPSLLMQGWNAILGSFQKSFADKPFSVSLIPTIPAFPPIAEDGSIITGARPDLTQMLLASASQKFPGRLVVQFDFLMPGEAASPDVITAVQTLGTMAAFQTNEYLGGQGAACSQPVTNPTPCTNATFLAMLEVGIYPLGPTNPLRAQYIEAFHANVSAFPAAVLQAHAEIFGLVAPPGPPTISLSNTQLQFWDYTAQSSLTPPQNIGVSNTGGGTLSWTATPGAPWINVTSTSSGFTVAVNPAGLAAGPHSATISVTAPGATNTPQTVSVTLTISAEALIPPASAARFVPVTPCRIADTRSVTGPFGGPGLPRQTSRDFAIPGSACGIPSSAMAYSLNVAVVPSGPLGFLTLWPTGQPQPLVATLNSIDGRIKSNAAIVPAGLNGAISTFVTDATDVILDINGYFVPASNASALAFYPVTPCRVADTRNAAGPLGGPSLAAQGTRSFPILGSSCGVPASAQAYSLNFAAVPKGPALGFITAWPAGQQQPLVASLNDPTGTVLSNAVVVPAGANGAVSVFTTDATDLVIDVNGYFAPPGSGGLSLYTVAPCRVIDTRLPVGSPPFNTTRDVNVVAAPCGVPATAQAFVFNATVVPPGFLGFITMWPQGQTRPLAATLNAYDGAVTNNMAIVPTTTGSVSVFPSAPTQLVLDLFGYFAP
jgi:hypothetical protein